jgi:nucleoside-diphosphate-sugar epimerase
VRVLVTGASGTLGAATARALAARGDQVTVLQRRPAGLGLPEVLADVADAPAVRAAAADQDAVIHLAARVGYAGRWPEYAHANIDGTRAVVAACRAAGVGRLVHVSSPSVAHAGSSLVGVGAGPADPERARGAYARSKAAAEQVALAANGPDLAVTAIRPHLVWGPGDQQLIGRVVERARTGRLVLVGTGAALMDSTYTDNAVTALLAALDRIDAAAGRALVVSNGEPRPVAELLAGICAAAGVPGPRRRVPTGLAYAAGLVAEGVGRIRRTEPPMTRFLAEQLSTAHWFDQRETRAVLAWTPEVSVEEGFARLAAAYRQPSSVVGPGGV